MLAAGFLMLVLSEPCPESITSSQISLATHKDLAQRGCFDLADVVLQSLRPRIESCRLRARTQPDNDQCNELASQIDRADSEAKELASKAGWRKPKHPFEAAAALSRACAAWLRLLEWEPGDDVKVRDDRLRTLVLYKQEYYELDGPGAWKMLELCRCGTSRHHLPDDPCTGDVGRIWDHGHRPELREVDPTQLEQTEKQLVEERDANEMIQIGGVFYPKSQLEKVDGVWRIKATPKAKPPKKKGGR